MVGRAAIADGCREPSPLVSALAGVHPPVSSSTGLRAPLAWRRKVRKSMEAATLKVKVLVSLLSQAITRQHLAMLWLAIAFQN